MKCTSWELETIYIKWTKWTPLLVSPHAHEQNWGASAENYLCQYCGSSSILTNFTTKVSLIHFPAHLRQSFSSRDVSDSHSMQMQHPTHLTKQFSSHQRNIPEVLIRMELFQYLFFNYWKKHQCGANNFLPLSLNFKWGTPYKTPKVFCYLSTEHPPE